MHTVLSVYLSKVLGPSSLLLLDWVGAAFRTDLYVTVGRQYPGPAGASGVLTAAFGNSSEAELEELFSPVAWYQKPSFADFMARVKEARKAGFAVGSRRHVSGHHASVRTGSVTVVGAAADPKRAPG
jgi:DNA-binding IclR family transcriptional regulator